MSNRRSSSADHLHAIIHQRLRQNFAYPRRTGRVTESSSSEPGVIVRSQRFRLVVGFATFLVGVAVNSTWRAPRTVSICELDANHERYEGKPVRLRALLTNDHRMITAFSVCSGNLPAAGLDLDLRDEIKLPMNELENGMSYGKLYLTEAILTGDLDPDYGGTHCWGPKYHISRARIERVVSRRQFDKMDEWLGWMESNYLIGRRN